MFFCTDALAESIPGSARNDGTRKFRAGSFSSGTTPAILWRYTRTSPRRLRLLGRRSGALRLLRELRESGRIEDREIGEHLAVERHPGGLQAMNQLAVGQAVLARGGADALNPQAAILALFYAAIAERIAVRAIGCLLRGLVQLALGWQKAFRALDVLLSAGAPV